MKFMVSFMLVLMLTATAKADDGGTACDSTPMTVVRTLADLPGPIKVLLREGNGQPETIADAGEDFNWTDVDRGDGLARQRFTFAALNPACAYVAIEKGGRTHHFELLIYKNDIIGWMLTERRRIEAAPSTVATLRTYAHITDFWTFTYPRQH